MHKVVVSSISGIIAGQAVTRSRRIAAAADGAGRITARAAVSQARQGFPPEPGQLHSVSRNPRRCMAAAAQSTPRNNPILDVTSILSLQVAHPSPAPRNDEHGAMTSTGRAIRSERWAAGIQLRTPGRGTVPAPRPRGCNPIRDRNQAGGSWPAEPRGAGPRWRRA